MLKKYLLFGVVTFIVLFAGAQDRNQESMNRLVNSSILYQILNDFDHSFPKLINSPGYFYIGDGGFYRNTYITESDYYDNENLTNSAGSFQNEIFSMINAALIRYIPVDSIMQVRITNGNNPVFELKFLRKTDTSVFIQSDPGRNRNKTISLAGGRIIMDAYYDGPGKTSYYSRLLSDSLRVNETKDERNDRMYRTEMKYQNGFLSEISYYEKHPENTVLISKDQYYQNINNRPGLKHTTNPNGKITDSTNYYYEGDKLILFRSYSGSNEKFSITYNYNRAGILSGKVVKTPTRIYASDYTFTNGRISDIEIDDRVKTFKRHYIFRTDANQRLSGIEYYAISKESFIENFKSNWQFEYDTKGNISFISLLDRNGEVSKKIGFIYDFFGTGE